MQYLDLNKLLNKYGERGFRIVAFPCNQFGYQEPGHNDEILNGLRYVRPGNNFIPHPTMLFTEKVEVNGKGAIPLYKYIKEKCPPAGPTFGRKDWLFWDELHINDLHWNFEKVLVDKSGTLRYRFESDDWKNGDIMEPFIDELLDEQFENDVDESKVAKPQSMTKRNLF